MVADYLPAGFEIDNPHLVSSGDTGTLSGSTDAQEPVQHRIPRRPLHRRVRSQGGRRAGIHGRLCRARGGARQIRACRRPYVEDMYRPDRYGRTGDRERGSDGGEMSDT